MNKINQNSFTILVYFLGGKCMKKIFLSLFIILLIVVTIFFVKNIIESSKIGNNMSNKSTEEIEQYILNMNSYEADVEIHVNSNKNENRYKAKQKYVKENNLYSQVMEEPENIQGVSFTYNGTNLQIKNKNLNLSKIYENYAYMGSNELSLAKFIEDYQANEETSKNEQGKEIVLETKIKNGNKYRAYKKLYINKTDGIPTKMEIQDITQNAKIYILYNEIKINNLQKEDILAFKLNNFYDDI